MEQIKLKIRKEYHAMPISSQAPNGEGSETISKESRVQADPKRPAPLNWGDDIVQSSWKREAALKRLVKGIRITKTGCWEWQGSKTVGYGTLKMPEIYGNFKILAHRLSWVAFKGEPIADGLFVCHRCDNRKCVNPDHLFLGTQQDNLQDCSSKGRTMTGSRNANSKYRREDIQAVKELIREGKSGVEIHSITGVSRTHISRIKRGYTWKAATASDADLVHANRKYTDEQLLQVARMILDGRLSNTEIASIVGTTRYLVQDMRRGRLHSRFMERAAK